MQTRGARMAAGFTLIEVLITVFVVGVLVALYGVGVMTTSLTREAAHQDIALHAASQQLESLRMSGYPALPASGSFANSQVTQLPSGSGAMTISALNAKTKQVVVTVSWQEGSRGSRSVSLSTYITETGGLP
ncbi:prepilin-type N-terminal cleavage/methylation domain-containing protein [Candidatus Kaiserbacteria bacterium]|nr:prepilin-type N-terminal cleavage/methylation domain-containing protein [Candidatus Kaiserbacteria bacterium]